MVLKMRLANNEIFEANDKIRFVNLKNKGYG